MPNGFVHKYPYQNFHELNLDWIMGEVEDLETLVNTFDSRITVLESDNTSSKARLDDLEAADVVFDTRIALLENDNTSNKGRLDALEAADIQDAVVLSDMTGVSYTASDATIGFSKVTYTDGAAGSPATDNAVLLPASNIAAGLMVPAQKQKLEAFSVDGSGNVTFSGTVGGDAPSLNTDYATKEYVDNLAISGSASSTTVSGASLATFSSNYTTERGAGNFIYGVKYGAARFLSFQMNLDTTSAVTPDEYGPIICQYTLVDTDFIEGLYAVFTPVSIYQLDANGVVEAVYNGYMHQINGKINFTLADTATIPSGKNIRIRGSSGYLK